MRKLISNIVILAIIAASSACTQGESEPIRPNESVVQDTAFTIHKKSQLIGGPVAQGRVGDFLLSNGVIRAIIQKSRKNASVNSFGGNIIDADLAREPGDEGQDNFGSLFPLVNIEWTVNYLNFEVLSDGKNGSDSVLRAHGKIDVYDYLDLDFIGDVAEGLVGQRIDFSNRFDDRRDPFDIYGDLRGISPDVVTDYTLAKGSNYIRIETTFRNNGDEDSHVPIGYFMNGSGEVSMLVPGLGFTPDLMSQVTKDTPAVIYAAFDNSDVSYGFFYDPRQFKDPETGKLLQSTSVTYSDVTGLLFGEKFLDIAPLGGGTPQVRFTIPAHSSKTISGYFVVGNGSAGSVLDAGLTAIKASTRSIEGMVKTKLGSPVEGATVAIMDKGATIITYRTDSAGQFSGKLPSGGDELSRKFGSGKYTAVVEMNGHHENETTEAGACTPEAFDISLKDSISITCTLGESGIVSLASPIIDTETKSPIAARLTIVGEDPSPNKVGSAGRFRSAIYWEPLFGIAGVKYIAANGTFDLTQKSSFELEPGRYLFVFSHGPEYTSDERIVEVEASKTTTIKDVKVARATKTPGYIGSDFHIHSITSPDSSMTHEMRVLTASAEGLDILQSSDHDYLTDYGPVIEDLESRGLIPVGAMRGSVGDEVTPNHYGHINAFPLTPNPEDPDNGAIDWSFSPRDEVSTKPDYVMSLDDLIDKLRSDPGEEVIQINHIMDNPTGLPLAAGWVTSPYYIENFGASPLSSYADPVERRMEASTGGTNFPLPFGTTGLTSSKFNTVELVVGPHLHNNELLFRSALPTWFNLLNIGIILTATADSDSHTGSENPVGLPRNYIASSEDPRDGSGSDHSSIDLEEYARSVNAHHVTVSAGPIIIMRATTPDGAAANIGDTIAGSDITIEIDVSAPSWAFFDTIDIYANTEPVPTDDKTDEPLIGTAADPAQFYKPYHTPRYTYQPTKRFSLSEGTLTDWKEENGAIKAHIKFQFQATEDTWIMAVAQGKRTSDGYRSLFPIVTRALVDSKDAPDAIDIENMSAFHKDARVGAAAWAFTNPIFIDIDGDGFKAIYMKSGLSPLGNR